MSNLTKTQKLWLCSLFCILILEIKVWASIFSGVMIEDILLDKYFFWSLMGGCVFVMGHYLLTFYFGYVRKGSRWLLWCLSIPLPISIMALGYVLFEDLHRNHLSLIISSGISLLIVLFYWVSCFVLRRENIHRESKIETSNSRI